MPGFNQGIITPGQVSGAVPNEVFGIAIQWFAPRTPMLYRCDKIPDGAPAYLMVGHKYRPRTTLLNAAVADGATTTITLLDASSFMQGDVLKLASGEVVEITADPNIGANTITVRRGIAGTTAAAQTNTTSVFLIGNSRTGGENNPLPVSSALTTVQQYAQTFQHPYSVGGGVQSNTLFPLSPGARSPLQQYKMDAMQNAMDDMEISSLYGYGESSAVGAGRAKQNGVRTVLVTNKTVSPTNSGAYKASDFQRDLLTAPRKGGGAPSAVYVASNWMDAFTIWASPLQRIDQGDTIYGRNIKAYSAPFLGDITIVESSLLPAFTAYSLTEEEVRFHVKRALTDETYGKRGDSAEGHMIGELSVEVDNEAHHAWVEGVTAFSP